MTSSIENPGNGTPFETVPVDEADEINKIVGLAEKLQDKRAETNEAQKPDVLRGVHPKSHGCVKAEFTVNSDIADKHKVGLFAHPGRKYEAWIRFSNASVLREDDLKADDKGERKNGSRGMAMKVMEVEGEMLDLDSGANNQDFLMINTPEFAFANVRDYLRLERILDQDPLGADPKPYFFPAALEELGEFVEGELAEITRTRKFLQNAVATNPCLNSLSAADLKGTIASRGVARDISSLEMTVRNPTQVSYFGAAPFLFGAGRVMQFSAVACPIIDQPPFIDAPVGDPSKDYLRDALTQTMGGENAVSFDFQVAVRGIGEDGLDIEDVTTSWDDSVHRYESVAQITITSPQNIEGDAAIEHCEKLAFNPWHSLADHRPLGGINRLRRKVYPESASHRGAGCG